MTGILYPALYKGQSKKTKSQLITAISSQIKQLTYQQRKTLLFCKKLLAINYYTPYDTPRFQGDNKLLENHPDAG